jgi:acetoacetate decarboxylase
MPDYGELPPSASITPTAPTYVPTGLRARQEGWTAPFLAPPTNEPPHPMEMARNLIIEFEPDPEAAAAAVPDPLIWAEGTTAVAVVGDNRQMPTSQAFQEGMILLQVKFGEKIGTFTPYIWTSTDEAMVAGREMSGRPKMMCDHNTLQVAGSLVRTEITRRGETLMRASVTPEFKADPSELPYSRDWYSVRKILMPEEGRPALKQVIHHGIGGKFNVKMMWRGRGFVEFPGTSFSAAHELRPRKILRAWMIEMSWELNWGKIVWENWVPPLQRR